MANQKKQLPIGTDDFRKLREQGNYYVDKTLFVQEFIENSMEVALITRPRRFGKTLNMTMLREFFDITLDSSDIFNGLTIMSTEYGMLINSRPVIYFSFKDSKGATIDELMYSISDVIYKEYKKYYVLLKDNVDESEPDYDRFFMLFEKLHVNNASMNELKRSIELLEQVLYNYYKSKPIVIIDEYDQPIMSSFEYGYHEHLQTFFSGLYGAALKGNGCLYKAVLTGIQRVVKESIFSQLNNLRVYTVIDERFSDYFGLNTNETNDLLIYYGFALDESVKRQYNGYLFHKTQMYNPWSILNYADTGQLEDYWINTSTNYLIRQSINEADEYFMKNFDSLIAEDIAKVSVDLGCSFIELKHNDTLWGLLINAGYITVLERIDKIFMKVRIPNGEVRFEFLRIIADRANIESIDLRNMFQCLLQKDFDGFLDIYRKIVISCTSFFDGKENAYHMLFLGMCITLNELYKISSNIESGYGRSDIRMQSYSKERPHIVIEFKHGKDLDKLKNEALRQILVNKYYSGLKGEVLCLGISHDKKKCGLAHEIITVD